MLIAEKYNITFIKKRKSARPKCSIKYSKKNNFSEAINIAVTDILYEMIIKQDDESSIQNVLFYLNRIYNTGYTDVPNRSYVRKSIQTSRWGYGK